MTDFQKSHTGISDEDAYTAYVAGCLGAAEFFLSASEDCCLDDGVGEIASYAHAAYTEATNARTAANKCEAAAAYYMASQAFRAASEAYSRVLRSSGDMKFSKHIGGCVTASQEMFTLAQSK